MISSQKLGERIAEARKSAGLNQAALATRLGMARTTIVAIEKGERRPANAELVRIAGIVGVSVHDLVRAQRTSPAVSPRFRLAPANAAEANLVQEAVNRLRRLGQRYAELERMHAIERVAPRLETIEAYRAGEGKAAVDARRATLLGRDAALTVRSLLGLGEGPALLLDERFEIEAGLRIFYLDRMPRHVAAFFLWGDEIGACVAVNRDHPPERQRWSLAHEVGHFLRDREAGDVLSDRPLSKDPSEVFAESFTEHFLMPESGLARQFADRCRANGDRFSAVDIFALAAAYEVSFQAMTLRLEGLGLLPAGTYDRLKASKIKPRDAAIKAGVVSCGPRARPVFPRRYIELAVAAYDKELISEGELAEIFETDRMSARQIFKEHEHLLLNEDQEMPVSVATEDLRAS